jgi:hypothetical protein
MVLKTRRAPLDDSPVPGIIPAPVRVEHREPLDQDTQSARRKAAWRPLISHARAPWRRRRTDRP